MQPNLTSHRHRDILLLVFSMVGILGLAGRGIYLVITGLTSSKLASMNDLASSLYDAGGMFFCAALLIPLLILCVRKLNGGEIHLVNLPQVKFWQVVVFLGAWVIMVVLGSVLFGLLKFGEVVALPFFLLGIAMPVTGLVWVAIGGLPAGSWRRFWAAFGIGMTGSTLGALLFEYSLVAIAALAAGIVAASNPDWLTIFQRVRNQVANAGDMQALLTTLAPYLTNPLVLLLALIFAAVLAPVIEETLKPAAVWLLGKSLRSHAEGFALGALCGAGFALLEGTLAAGGSTQMFGIGIAGRAASSLMHITATGLMGWGIASARLEKRYGRLVGAFLISVSIHGLWNGSVILAVFGALRLTLPGGSSDPLGILFVLAGIGILGSLFVAIMILLPIINRRLRPVPPVSDRPMQSDIIAPPHL
jgi:hypothetical protein